MNLENQIKQKAEVVETVNDEKPAELKYVGTLKPKRGHRVYEINISTLEINEATYDEKTDFVLGNGKMKNSKRKKLIMNKDCVYVSALNAKNAIKKINKGIREGYYKLEQLPENN